LIYGACIRAFLFGMLRTFFLSLSPNDLFGPSKEKLAIFLPNHRLFSDPANAA